MRATFTSFRYSASILRTLIWVIIAAGVVLRLTTFFHNRNLIIDEANIVRNLSERGFAQLVLPLKYEQYAPPVFLWIEKLFSILFGYGEQAMRIYPLLCGVAAIFLFLDIAKRLISRDVLWLPLAYLCGGFVFIKYSVEVKQYMPDAFTALLLIWLTLRWDIKQLSRFRFAIQWIIAGSLAIWSSMPSVFILTAIGCYYGWLTVREKRYRDILMLSLIAAVWLAQFALYYLTILKAQINSSYLQNYHQDYFLIPFPSNYIEWKHDWKRLEDILGNVGGWTAVSVVSNFLLFLIGGIRWLLKRTSVFILVALPVFLVIIAAAFRQFSLIDRVILFSFPLWMLLIGAGFETLWRFGWQVKAILLIVGVYNAYTYFDLRLIRQPYEFHEITKGLEWIRTHNGRGQQLYVHDANVPTYIYYTELHPDRAHWTALLGAHRLRWDENYTNVTQNIKDTAYFLYTGGFSDSEREKRTKEIEQNMQQAAYFESGICYVYVYVPKPDK